jgi:hypothetical protein
MDMLRGSLGAGLFIILLSAAGVQAEDTYHCALCVGRANDAEFRVVFFRMSDDLPSTIKADGLTVRSVTNTAGALSLISAPHPDGYQFSGPYRIDKEVYDQAVKGPGELPDATTLITLHNVEPRLGPRGHAPDLIRERFQLAASHIIPRADR